MSSTAWLLGGLYALDNDVEVLWARYEARPVYLGPGHIRVEFLKDPTWPTRIEGAFVR